MLGSPPDESPSAHAEIEIRFGGLLPSVAARTTVPSKDAKQPIRILGFVATAVTIGAVAGIGVWLAVPPALVVIIVIVLAVFGGIVTLRE